MNQLESGDLKLRVRVLEVNPENISPVFLEINLSSILLNYLYIFGQSERAARKASILQMATLYTVLSGTLVNSGIALSGQGTQVLANGSFVGAGIYAFGFKLVDRLICMFNSNPFSDTSLTYVQVFSCYC